MGAVVDGVFEEISLEQYKGKWVLLAFIPLAFTFVCPTEIIAYSEAIKKFQDKDTEVLLASTDHTLSRDYGVLLEEEGVALRGIFLIDPKGTLRQITINDLPVGRSVEESLRLVEAFQFTEKYGEVCPANWQPGSETIKPGVDSAKEYFGKVNK